MVTPSSHSDELGVEIAASVFVLALAAVLVPQIRNYSIGHGTNHTGTVPRGTPSGSSWCLLRSTKRKVRYPHVSQDAKRKGGKTRLREVGMLRRQWDCWLNKVGLMPTREVP